ncbi:MAG: ABC transporter permease [Gammaproteobacteria bacterium]
MPALQHSFKTLRREWRSGELRLIAAALVVAVAAVTAVTLFTDRVRQAMVLRANTLLAADLALDSSFPIAEPYLEEARRLGLETAQTLSFRSMLVVGERMQLVEVKAVDRDYPLRGRLAVGTDPFAAPVPTDVVPEPGIAWADAQLAQVLKLAPGQGITLGDATLAVGPVLLYEPDRGGEAFHIAPRLLMNRADVPATGLIAPGSRVSYRLLVAGEPRAIGSYRGFVEARANEAVELVSVGDARPALRVTLERGEQYLRLTALASLFLAGIAIAMAARRFATRHLDHCAILRTLGATQGFILRVYALCLLWLGLLTSALGCLVGAGAQFVLARLLTGLVEGDLPAPSWTPLAIGTVTGLTALIGFALPPIAQLRHTPPARVLRRDLGSGHPPAHLIYVAAIATLLLLTSWHAQEIWLTLYVVGGSFATTAALALCGWLLVRGLRPLCRRVGIAWRYGLANIARRGAASVAQSVALGLGIMAILLLTVVRGDLLANWQARLPPDAPNHFAINIQPAEVEAVRAFFAEHGRSPPTLYPIVHGRLRAIGGKPIAVERYEDERARRLAGREFHLTWAAELPHDNRVLAGRWWGSGASRELSVETELAALLGIRLGDRLRFQVLDQDLEGTVTSLRSVAWDSFNPNFFVIAAPGMLDAFSESYITSFYLGGEQKPWLFDLVKRFPSVTLLDLAALMDEIQAIIDRVAMAVEFVFGFALLAGLLVLFAAVHATLDERLRESAVLRTLGAGRGVVARGLAAEFLTLGVIAGLLAAVGASGIGFLLARHVFDIAFTFNLALLAYGIVGGGLGVTAFGLIATRPVLNSAPLETLRRV